MTAALRLAAIAAVLSSSCLAMKVPFIRRYEPVWYDLEDMGAQHRRLTRGTAEGGERSVNLQFTAMGRAFDLVLVPDTSIFHKEFTFHSSDGPVDANHLKISTYTGYDRNTPGSRVHGNVISGVFAGTIYTDRDTYYIEPAHRYARDTAHHSIIYRHSDINQEALRGAKCGLSDASLVGYLEREGRSLVTPDTPEVLRDVRQARDQSLVRCDLNVTGDYKFFFEVTQGVDGVEAQRMVAASLLTGYIQQASDIFKRTDFDSNGTRDNIQFGIRDLVIETEPSLAPFDEEFIGVERFLRLHSDFISDFDFCLSYRFTHRDFDGGVLGLAYVAKQGSAGGICERSLNTGIVTTLNYGQRVPPIVTSLTFAHEAGHNFGSDHDPAECAPGGSDGNFIMYAYASNGQQSNNDNFSPCSREMMDEFIETRGQDASREVPCFSAADDLCQNGLLDDEEEDEKEREACDCGIDYDEETGVCNDDRCCIGETCQLNNAECSPDQGPCCDGASCSFLDQSVRCADATDCGKASHCNSNPSANMSAICPEPEARSPPVGLGYIICNNDTATCVDNMCTGSLCVVLNATMCTCTAEEQVCDLCCMIEGECISTITIAEEGGVLAGLLPGEMGLHLPEGTPCNDFIGYCDALNNCFQVDSEGALDRLGELFSAGNVNEAIDFIREKWWAVVAAGAGLLIGVFVLILIVHLVLPRPEHVKARSQRRQTIRRNRQVGRAYPGGQEMKHH